jgi:hypothetical protein
MGFFGLLFWIVVLWFVIRLWRRSDRCVGIGAGGYPSRWDTGDRYGSHDLSSTSERTRQEYIDSLESRLAELEERLDFTERLLASRGER